MKVLVGGILWKIDGGQLQNTKSLTCGYCLLSALRPSGAQMRLRNMMED